MGARVTSAEFQKAFVRYRDLAQREPVSITNHGRECLVLLSAEEYSRLKQLDRRALYPWELDEAALKALDEAQVPEEAATFDSEVDS